jgi:hypothetical protein
MADKLQSFCDVRVSQNAHAFTFAVYRSTDAFERVRKRTTPDKLCFYNIALGSADDYLHPLIDTLPHQTNLGGVSRLLERDGT